MLVMNRDKELFSTLHGFGLLTTKQIAGRFFPSIATTTVLRRLRKLEDGNYIRRIEGLLNNERAWALTQVGADVVSVQDPKVYFRKDQLNHDLKLSEVRMALETHGMTHSWIPEHEIRAKVCAKNGPARGQFMLIPDGIIGVEHKGLKESVALELELNFKNSKRYERTFSAYSKKQNIWAIWYVVASPSLGKSIARVAARELKYNQKIKFFWSLADDVIANPLTAKIYQNNECFEFRNIFSSTKPAQVPALGVSM